MERRQHLSLVISPALAGKTVAQVLRLQLGLSAAAIRRAKLLPEGITLDGSRVFTNETVRAGQLLCVALTAQGATVTPVSGPLDIIHEDADLLIVNKPAGLMVHPRGGELENTLANYLCHHFLQNGQDAQIHLVNRLDRGTSGLLLVARHSHAHARLIAQLHSGSFLRDYLAVCEGAPTPAEGLLDFPIGRCDESPIRRRVRPDGAPARTHYRTLASDGRRSLLALRLENGRTHQIRVHLSHIGNPVSGDFLYGTEHPDLPRRLALHCAKLTLTHPLDGSEIAVSAPLPPEFRALLQVPVKDFPLGGIL